jgi:hypothetical protein
MKFGSPPLPRISLTRFARSESPRLVNVRSQLRVIGEVVALVACSLVLHSLLRRLRSVRSARKVVTPWWSSVLVLLGLDDPSSLPLRHSSATPGCVRSLRYSHHPLPGSPLPPSTLSKTPLVTSCHGIALLPWPAQRLRGSPHFSPRLHRMRRRTSDLFSEEPLALDAWTGGNSRHRFPLFLFLEFF